MIIVYTAAGIMDAHLIRGLLESEGVHAEVFGADLQGAIGELPVAGLITVRVSEDCVERARAIIDDYDAAVFSMDL